jgi:hypothetical protein
MAKAKKAEKALADANQGRIQREEVITDRLNRILALACSNLTFKDDDPCAFQC